MAQVLVRGDVAGLARPKLQELKARVERENAAPQRVRQAAEDGNLDAVDIHMQPVWGRQREPVQHRPEGRATHDPLVLYRAAEVDELRLQSGTGREQARVGRILGHVERHGGAVFDRHDEVVQEMGALKPGARFAHGGPARVRAGPHIHGVCGNRLPDRKRPVHRSDFDRERRDFELRDQRVETAHDLCGPAALTGQFENARVYRLSGGRNRRPRGWSRAASC